MDGIYQGWHISSQKLEVPQKIPNATEYKKETENTFSPQTSQK